MRGGARVEVVTTKSGARALLDRDVGEVMHPVIGPLVESRQLYVAPSRLSSRLEQPGPSPLVLLDVGLGAGSNASAAWRVARALPRASRRLRLLSFDRDLQALRLAAEPAHRASFGLDGCVATATGDLLGGGFHESDGHEWRVVLGGLPRQLDSLPDSSADIVFWDPFSPKANPELWTVAAFRALRRVCREGCSVHTYSGATSIRAALLLAGFVVGFGEPSGEKGQTTIAAVCEGDVPRPLDQRWLQRLARSSAPLPADAPEGALGKIAELPQFTPRLRGAGDAPHEGSRSV